jgi:hypothetical protein
MNARTRAKSAAGQAQLLAVLCAAWAAAPAAVQRRFLSIAACDDANRADILRALLGDVAARLHGRTRRIRESARSHGRASAEGGHHLLRKFLADCTEPGANSDRVQASALHRAFCAWASSAGERPWSSTRLGRELRAAGYWRLHSNFNYWLGLRLVRLAPPAAVLP